MNSIFTIHPYADGGALVFDDPSVGLVREALVGGTDTILELAAKLADADPVRFTLLFSAIPFPGHQAMGTHLEKGELEFGDWYAVALPGLGVHEGWLCPALLKYFSEAPAVIYFKVQPFERKA